MFTDSPWFAIAAFLVFCAFGGFVLSLFVCGALALVGLGAYAPWVALAGAGISAFSGGIVLWRANPFE